MCGKYKFIQRKNITFYTYDFITNQSIVSYQDIF